MQWNPATWQFFIYQLVIIPRYFFGLKKRWNSSFFRLSQRASGRAWKKGPCSLPSSYAARVLESLANVGLHSHWKRCPRQEGPNIRGASIVFRDRRMPSQTLLILLHFHGSAGFHCVKPAKKSAWSRWKVGVGDLKNCCCISRKLTAHDANDAILSCPEIVYFKLKPQEN